MTTLAIGASVSLSLGNNGFLDVATNGGFGSVTITPTNGAAVSESWGPYPLRKRFAGPFPEGAAVVLTNTSCASLDYETDTSNLPGSVQALVSADGNQPSATLAAITGTPGQVIKLSDGPDKGVALVWAIPAGASTYAWCWQIYPQASYL